MRKDNFSPSQDFDFDLSDDHRWEDDSGIHIHVEFGIFLIEAHQWRFQAYCGCFRVRYGRCHDSE